MWLINNWNLDSYTTIIHKPSLLAVNDIPDQIDFLHLDGDYSEIGSLRDVIVI